MKKKGAKRRHKVDMGWKSGLENRGKTPSGVAGPRGDVCLPFAAPPLRRMRLVGVEFPFSNTPFEHSSLACVTPVWAESAAANLCAPKHCAKIRVSGLWD